MSARMGISGGAAGCVAAVGFALVHGLMISDIWFSLPMLLVAGALCGSCLGATYGLVCDPPSLRSWSGYNALFVGFFLFLAVLSELVYEPVITLSELMAGPPPSYLWGQTMPLIVLCTLLMAVLLFRLYGHTRKQFAALLATCAILSLLLGLNISLMGVVSVPVESLYVVARSFGLILVLNLIFTVSFAGLEWKHLSANPDSSLPGTRLSSTMSLRRTTHHE